MKTIDNDIKNGSFRQIYLLFGEERYLIKQYKDKLIKAMVTEGDTMNFNTFEGKDINVNEVVDLSETLPFFADRRLILIEDSGLLKKGGEELPLMSKDEVADKLLDAILKEQSEK